MKDAGKKRTSELLKKLSPVILLSLGLLLILISYIGDSNESEKTVNGYEDADYAEYLEGKLKNILESVTGEDSVNVMITFKNIPNNSEKQANPESFLFTSSQKEDTDTERTPEIGGVIIVCKTISEAEDFLTIKKAASTALDIQENKIYVIGGYTQ